jgi:hypothetical protein
MAEIASEREWLSPDDALEAWGNPVKAAHDMAAFQYHFAMECAEAARYLIESIEPPFVHAPGTFIRPVLESSGRSYWLSELGIGIRERVRRGVNDRLDALYWATKLGPPDERSRFKQRIRDLIAAGALLGFEVLPRSQSPQRFLAAEGLDEPVRPSTQKVLESLFGDIGADSSVSRLLMLFGSAFVHSSPLAQTIYAEPVMTPGSLDVDRALIRLTDRDANVLLACVVISLAIAGRARYRFNGWEDSEWLQLAEDSLRLARTTMTSYKESWPGSPSSRPT